MTMTEPDPPMEAVAGAVGWVAIEAARLELVAAQLEAAMIGSPRALPVVQGQGWTATKQALEVLIKDRLERTESNAEGRIDISFLESTRESVRSADTLMEHRANVVHALWEPARHVDERTSLTLKRWGKYRRTDWTLAALATLRADLRTVCDELEAHFEREVGPPDDL